MTTTITKSTMDAHKAIIDTLHNGDYADGTYNVNTMEPVSFDKGYQVTFWTIGMNYSADDYEFIHSMFSEFSMDGMTYVGYFDGGAEISYRIESKHETVKLAKMYNQVCVWDWKNCECIDTNGSGRSN